MRGIQVPRLLVQSSHRRLQCSQRADRPPDRRTISALRQWENFSMKHVYVPRMTSYTLNPEDELNDLRMSEQVRPLYDHVRQFIRDTVEPMSAEFYRLGEKKKDRAGFTPPPLPGLQEAKHTAR